MTMTAKEFWAAIGIRDFHQKRIIRFNNGRPLRGETPSDLRRSIILDRECTSFLGDGLSVELPWNTQLLSGMAN